MELRDLFEEYKKAFQKCKEILQEEWKKVRKIFDAIFEVVEIVKDRQSRKYQTEDTRLIGRAGHYSCPGPHRFGRCMGWWMRVIMFSRSVTAAGFDFEN